MHSLNWGTDDVCIYCSYKCLSYLRMHTNEMSSIFFLVSPPTSGNRHGGFLINATVVTDVEDF